MRSGLALLLGAVIAVTATTAVFADGTEFLGTPSIAIGDGTSILAAGVGMRDSQPGTINLDIPAGATIVQALLYWEGLHDENPFATDTINVNGIPVTGDLIGGPTYMFEIAYTKSYRADITGMGLVSVGSNSLEIDGLDFYFNNGAGLAVTIDQGGGSTTTVVDGNDLANYVLGDPYNVTEPVTFTFDPSDVARSADLDMFFTAYWGDRPTIIRFYVDGTEVDQLNDAIGHFDGVAWNTISHSVAIPAGATSLTIQAFNEDSGVGAFAGGPLGKFVWIYTGLTLEDVVNEEPVGGEGCTPGYWKNHEERWDGLDDDDFTSEIQSQLSFNMVLGVSPADSGLSDSVTLIQACALHGGGLKALARHTAAALASSDSGISYEYTIDQVIALYQDAVGVIDGPLEWESAKNLLAAANEAGCPLN